jgi:hypothetical protein
MTKCFWFGHDWYIMDEDYDYVDGDGTYITYYNKVCLRCKLWEEGIPRLKALREQRRQSKLSRKELANELWDDRYNPNDS